MAEGRLINKRIGLDRAVNALCNDTSRLAFTWTISHLDRDGRVTGDPAALRSIVFPRRDDIGTEEMRGYIEDWAHNGLVKWYRADDDLWLEFPGFRKNQPNLRHDREPASSIPPANRGEPVSFSIQLDTPADCRQGSGGLPADCRRTAGEHPAEVSKRREVKEVMNELGELQNAAPTASPAGSERPAGRPDTGAAKSDLPEPAIPLSGLTPELARRVVLARRAEAARDARRNGKSTTLVTTSVDNGHRYPPLEADIVNDDDDFDDAPLEVSDAAV